MELTIIIEVIILAYWYKSCSYMQQFTSGSSETEHNIFCGPILYYIFQKERTKTCEYFKWFNFSNNNSRQDNNILNSELHWSTPRCTPTNLTPIIMYIQIHFPRLNSEKYLFSPAVNKYQLDTTTLTPLPLCYAICIQIMLLPYVT